MGRIATAAKWVAGAVGAAVTLVLQTPPDVAASNAALWVEKITGKLPNWPQQVDVWLTLPALLVALTPLIVWLLKRWRERPATINDWLASASSSPMSSDHQEEGVRPAIEAGLRQRHVRALEERNRLDRRTRLQGLAERYSKSWEDEGSSAERHYKEELAKQEGVIRAKAKMMEDRLDGRGHSVGPPVGQNIKADTYLAAMWDAEQRGEIYDETHRFTSKRPGPAGEEEAAEKKAEQERLDRRYKAEIEREQASLKAKAEMMKQRLYSRNFSIPGASDHYLAGMWDAEQKGEVYDETHKRSLRRPN